jgi:hypothetical protein
VSGELGCFVLYKKANRFENYDRGEELKVPRFPMARSCHYTHLPEGCDMENISKSRIETVDFHLKCISREEWNINFYRL